MAYHSKNHELTVEFIRLIRRQKDTNLVTKTVDRYLDKLGITRSSIIISGRRINEYKTDNSKQALSDHTRRLIVTLYLNAVKSLNAKNFAYEKRAKPKIDALERHIGVSELTRQLYPHNPLPTIRGALVKLRKAHRGSAVVRALIDEIKPEHHAFYMLKSANKHLASITNAKAEEVLRKKHDNRLRINPEYITEKSIQVIKQKNPDRYDMVAAIALITGRRLSEIIKTGHLKEESKNTATFTGQLKTKTRNEGRGIDGYEIPLLYSAKQVILALKRVQMAFKNTSIEYKNITGETIKSTVGDKTKKTDTAHTRAIARNFSATIADRISRWLDVEGATCKTMRALYTEIAHKQYSKTGESKSAFAARVLGYDESDLTVALNYEQVEMDASVKKAQIPKTSDNKNKKLVEYLQDKTEAIETRHTRAKAMHRLHKELIRRAQQGELTKKEDITTTRLRRIPVDGKLTNPNTVKTYIKTLIG